MPQLLFGNKPQAGQMQDWHPGKLEGNEEKSFKCTAQIWDHAPLNHLPHQGVADITGPLSLPPSLPSNSPAFQNHLKATSQCISRQHGHW